MCFLMIFYKRKLLFHIACPNIHNSTNCLFVCLIQRRFRSSQSNLVFRSTENWLEAVEASFGNGDENPNALRYPITFRTLESSRRNFKGKLLSLNKCLEDRNK